MHPAAVAVADFVVALRREEKSVSLCMYVCMYVCEYVDKYVCVGMYVHKILRG